jgi:mannose-6-phosphate isomerase-like protein (cupin superfamily)
LTRTTGRAFNGCGRLWEDLVSNCEISEERPKFSIGNYGASGDWSQAIVEHPHTGRIAGKGFIGQDLGLSGMEISLNSILPGTSAPFVHGHRQNEEAYLFLNGAGQFMLDEIVIDVRAGTVIRVDPHVLRCWRNTGSEPLVFVVVQAKAGSLTQATTCDGFVSNSPAVWDNNKVRR